MSFHSHGEKTFEAKRVFTGREEAIALFDKALAEPQERDHHHVICWHGVGGQGKSSLRQELCRRVANKKDIALASLDFDEPRHRRLVDALLKIRGDLSGRGLSFPTFDLAFARHFALERPGENIREVYPQLYHKGESELLDDLIGLSGTVISESASLFIPGINLLYKYGHRLTGRIGEWWASNAVKDQLADLDLLSTSQLSEKLPRYIGFDIWRALDEKDCPRVVITIDSHEKLSGGEFSGDAWLQTLVRETPGALIMIFGRDKLLWEEIDDRWTDVLDQIPLEALSDREANAFLAKVPIKEVDIRERIIYASKGLPHYLDLSVTLYEDILNAGDIPVVDNFGATNSGVREQFIVHLPHSERHELFLAAYSESLTERLFYDLAETFLGGAGNVNWARMARRSFMSSVNNRLVMHGLMREALQEQDRLERPEFFALVHEHLFERYATSARVPDAISVTPSAEAALLSSAFHASRLGPVCLLNWIQATYEPYFQASRFRLLILLYEDALLLFPEESMDRAWLLSQLAGALNHSGNNAEALKLYRQVLMIYKTAFGENHQHYASALHNQTRVIQTMGRHKEAQKLYEQVLSIYKVTAGERHPNYASTLHALADVLQDLGKNSEALTLHEQALAILKTEGREQHPDYATTLHSMASAYRDMGCYTKAVKLYKQAQTKYKAMLGEQHPYYATTLHGLGSVYQAMGHYAHAEMLYRQAQKTYEISLGEQHSFTIINLANLAGCQAILGKFEEARSSIALALNHASSLPESTVLVTGRVHLKWAQGLAEAGLSREAQKEALTAADLLAKTLGSEAALTGQAWKLIDDITEE